MINNAARKIGSNATYGTQSSRKKNSKAKRQKLLQSNFRKPSYPCQIDEEIESCLSKKGRQKYKKIGR